MEPASNCRGRWAPCWLWGLVSTLQTVACGPNQALVGYGGAVVAIAPPTQHCNLVLQVVVIGSWWCGLGWGGRDGGRNGLWSDRHA